MMHRRTFVLGSGLALLGSRVIASAESNQGPPLIGYVAFNTEVIGRDVLHAFREAMQELGWIDGQSVLIHTRFANGQADRLPALVADLLRRKVDVIVTSSSAATRASKAATTNTPIVMLASADAVNEGFVTSLARPGGNVTGMTLLAGPEIASKQLEFLLDIAPGNRRVATLVNSRNGSHAAFVAELMTAARKLGAGVQPVPVESPNQLDDAFAAMAKERVSGLLVLSDAMFFGERRRIADLARSRALPAMYSQSEFVEAGGLVSYGPSLVDMSRRGARHVDRILRGSKPEDLPVEQPTKFELIINAKTAKALAVTIPQSLRLRADKVIE